MALDYVANRLRVRSASTSKFNLEHRLIPTEYRGTKQGVQNQPPQNNLIYFYLYVNINEYNVSFIYLIICYYELYSLNKHFILIFYTLKDQYYRLAIN